MEGSEPVDFAGPATRWFGARWCGWTITVVRRYLAKVFVAGAVDAPGTVGRAGSNRRGGPPAKPFERRYTRLDIRLLARLDAELGQMSGPATRAVLRRQWEVFGDARFERLARLSNGHLYNLRKSRTYRNVRRVVERTRPTSVAIGVRRRPDPGGAPGHLRVDTVHQGDLDGVKGVYHINAVDEVTQWQQIGTVEAISEAFPIPVLQALLGSFPFRINGFHADNGSEYINHRVAALLTKLHVGTFTKSLPGAERYLVEGLSFETLDAQAHAVSDFEAAEALNRARRALFRRIGQEGSVAA